MSSCTALIVHPDFRQRPTLVPDLEPECLERYGRSLAHSGKVHYAKGLNLPRADFFTWRNSPDYQDRPQRAPRQEDEYHIDCRNMARAVRLLDTFTAGDAASMRAIAEIRRRILVTHPHCLDA